VSRQKPGDPVRVDPGNDQAIGGNWFGTGPLDFFVSQILQMRLIPAPVALAGLVFYFRLAGARYRLLDWSFVFLRLILTLLHLKTYFLAPAYRLLYAPGAVVFERLRLGPRLARLRPAYFALLALVGVVLSPDVVPILPPAMLARSSSLPLPAACRRSSAATATTTCGYRGRARGTCLSRLGMGPARCGACAPSTLTSRLAPPNRAGTACRTNDSCPLVPRCATL